MSNTKASPNIYTMKLHETLTTTEVARIEIQRVPGGWIYTRYTETSPHWWSTSMIFVPYSDEFYMPENCHWEILT